MHVHAELLEKLHRDILVFAAVLRRETGRRGAFVVHEIDRLNKTRIEKFLNPNRNIKRCSHTAFVFADRTPRNTKHMAEIPERHTTLLPKIPEHFTVDIDIQSTG